MINLIVLNVIIRATTTSIIAITDPVFSIAGIILPSLSITNLF